MKYRRLSRHEMHLLFYAKQHGRCWLCGEMLDLFLSPNTWGACSWEHVIPASSGGSDRHQNMALTHWECNKARRDRLIWRLARPRTRKELRTGYCARKMQHEFDKTVQKLSQLLKHSPTVVGLR